MSSADIWMRWPTDMCDLAVLSDSILDLYKSVIILDMKNIKVFL